MRKTDGSKVTQNSNNYNVFKLVWIFIGLTTILVTFTGCSEYILNFETSETSCIAAHRTWCGDCRIFAGIVDEPEANYSGLTCVYPNYGCCSSNSEALYIGCTNSDDDHAITFGDTASCGVVAGIFNGCACVACGDEEQYTQFGYTLPMYYEIMNIADIAATIDSCTGMQDTGE
ncbi:MAG: hypothetical protein J6K17_13590 [Oscillospiraceae bacterium]|nr:hypothetical protein [Oscillospiraceae bacterium]